ncbi:hypothetical protein SGRI78S_01543 [Streptomyces griseus subsp. griseus]
MMSAYCASKAGAESFALALRGEVEPDGVRVGIAYLHWTGTDMLTGIDDDPVLEALRRNQPRPARRVHSSAQVAQWLTRGIARRSRNIYAPPWLRWCQPLRPLFPVLVARAARRELRARPSRELSAPVEVLGAGGRADWRLLPGLPLRPSGRRVGRPAPSAGCPAPPAAAVPHGVRDTTAPSRTGSFRAARPRSA